MKARESVKDGPALSKKIIKDLAIKFVQAIDQQHGGIKGAPKFPQTPFFSFLWQAGIRYRLPDNLDAVKLTLTKICQGGIYDHLGGGFARYSVDEFWLIPHFEKMLYDNAQLISLMTEVYREGPVPLFKTRIEETVDWLLREMVTEDGGFAASYDADSEGEEGKFYVWSKEEVMTALGPQDGHFFCTVYDITEDGNFEGKNNPNRLKDFLKHTDEDEARLKSLRSRLFTLREKRVRPGWDDKVLADWNGLTITALARAGDVFGEPDWISAARRAFDVVCEKMMSGNRLIHAYRAGQGRAPATASDYANMTEAALTLHLLSGEAALLDQAGAWEDVLARHYWDAELGGYFLTADDTKDVIVRLKTANDEATPNANAVMASNLTALFLLTGDERYREKAERLIQVFNQDMVQNLIQHAGMLSAGITVMAPQHVVIVPPPDEPEGEGRRTEGEGAQALRQITNTLSLPGTVVQLLDGEAPSPATGPAAGQSAKNGQATAYVCSGQSCSAPVTAPEDLRITLQRQRSTSTDT